MPPSELPSLCQDPIISLNFSNLMLYPHSEWLWSEGIFYSSVATLDAYVYPQQEDFIQAVNTTKNNTIATTNQQMNFQAREGITFDFQLGPSGADPIGTISIASAQLPLTNIFCQGQNNLPQSFNLQNQNDNSINGTYLFISECDPAVFNNTPCDQVENIQISSIQYQNESSENMPTFNQSFYVGIVPSQVLAAVFPNNFNLNPNVANVQGQMPQPQFQQTFNNTYVLYDYQFQLKQRTGIKVCYGMLGDYGCCISSNQVESSINNFQPVDCVELAFSELNCNDKSTPFKINKKGTNEGDFIVTGICTQYQNITSASIF